MGSLVASGAVALGFQQLSELLHVEGIAIVGPLPPAIQITTTFCAAITTLCRRSNDAHALLAYMASGDTAAAARRHGMVPA